MEKRPISTNEMPELKSQLKPYLWCSILGSRQPPQSAITCAASVEEHSGFGVHPSIIPPADSSKATLHWHDKQMLLGIDRGMYRYLISHVYLYTYEVARESVRVSCLIGTGRCHQHPDDRAPQPFQAPP